jgi:hypothetical protein
MALVGRMSATGVLAAIGAVTPAPIALAAAPTSLVAANTTTPDFAGYMGTPAPSGATITAKFTVPSFDPCGPQEGAAAEAGLIDSKGNSAAGAVIFGCQNQTFFYIPVIQADNTSNDPKWPVGGGNVITISASEVAGKATVTMKDVTLGKSKTITGLDSGASDSKFYAGMSVYDNPSPLPIPSFGQLTFKHVLLNGSGITGAAAYDLESGSDIQIQTGARTPRATNSQSTLSTQPDVVFCNCGHSASHPWPKREPGPAHRTTVQSPLRTR